MNGLSLCSGIGGLDLGLGLAIADYATIAWCENDPFCQDILLARMADGIFPLAPIWNDLKSFDGRCWRGLVDIVHAGYPCQPFSVAGRQRGADDPRHLWPDVARVVREVEPPFVFLENVAGHLRLGYREVASDLLGMGYRVATRLFTAEEVSAPHQRQRLFALACLANTRFKHSSAWRTEPSTNQPSTNLHDQRCNENVDDAVIPRLERRHESLAERADELPPWPPGPAERDRWDAVLNVHPKFAPAVGDTIELDTGTFDTIQAGRTSTIRSSKGTAQPNLRRMAHGSARRMDRLRACGNAVVPAVAALAWRTLLADLCAT